MSMTTELAIIGAGPAGMAAAKVAASHGVSVTVIDEQRAAGGQFLRQPPAEFSVSDWLSGNTYQAGKSLVSEVSNLPGIRWLMQSTVSGLMRPASVDQKIALVIDPHPGAAGASTAEHTVRTLEADNVLLAPGCFDLPVQFSGWNLPGVMAAGGIQAFVKSQQFVPGEEFVFAGTHPLQLVVADQIIQAGGKVAAVLFAQSQSRALTLLRHPSVILGNLGKFSLTASTLKRIRRAGVAVRFNQTLIEAQGQLGLERVLTAPIDSKGAINRSQIQTIECDRLGICFGFATSPELARQAGAESRWDAPRGGFIVNADKAMQSSVKGLFVAGEITGVAGADVAMLEGRIAAHYILARLGRISAAQADQACRPIRDQLRKAQQFADLLTQLAGPPESLLDQLLEASVMLCKCEEVTVGAMCSLLQENPHVTTANAAKLLSRVGMGLCQGRYCHHGLTRLMASQRQMSDSAVGGFTARFPSKPVAIDQLIGESGDDQ